MGERVRPDGLNRLGGLSRDIGDAGVGVPLDHLKLVAGDAAGARMTGLASYGALQECAQTWTDVLTRLGANLTSTGDKLTATATAFVGHDQAGMDQFTQVPMPEIHGVGVR